MPTTVTWGVMRKSNRCCSKRMASPKLTPGALSGRPMTSRVTPAFWAAETFSKKPPLLPVCLVTRIWALQAWSMATFSSSGNGPWTA